jgi:hypothetical protein
VGRFNLGSLVNATSAWLAAQAGKARSESILPCVQMTIPKLQFDVVQSVSTGKGTAEFQNATKTRPMRRQKHCAKKLARGCVQRMKWAAPKTQDVGSTTTGYGVVAQIVQNKIVQRQNATSAWLAAQAGKALSESILPSACLTIP